MSRRGKSTKRKINPTIFVFCEGETEEAYVNFLKSRFRLPSIVIKTKVNGQNISEKIIKNTRKQTYEHAKDKTYLMYDLDVPGILSKLQAIPKVELLLSNPCIELWFLLHFKNQKSQVTGKNCLREITNRHMEYSKGNLSPKLASQLEKHEKKATERAKVLNPFSNPSTSVYRLIEFLNELKLNSTQHRR